MDRLVYIDGNLLVSDGILYGLSFCAYADEKYKTIANKIIPCNEKGYYEVTNDNGSIFTQYYVKEGITIYGLDGNNIISFSKDHERTYDKYKKIQNDIINLLEKAIIPKECENYFYLQQYTSIFANLEYFLYGTLMWEICKHYDSYQRILNAHFSFLEYDKETKHILRGEHCLLQEKTFIEQIQHIVYHNTTQVRKIFNVAFNFDVDLNIIKNELDIRHHIVHRAGYTKDDHFIVITKNQVLNLIKKIDDIVESVTININEFNRINDTE